MICSNILFLSVRDWIWHWWLQKVTIWSFWSEVTSLLFETPRCDAPWNARLHDIRRAYLHLLPCLLLKEILKWWRVRARKKGRQMRRERERRSLKSCLNDEAFKGDCRSSYWRESPKISDVKWCLSSNNCVTVIMRYDKSLLLCGSSSADWCAQHIYL